MKARDRMRLGTIRISGSILAWSAVFVLNSATFAQESPRSLEGSPPDAVQHAGAQQLSRVPFRLEQPHRFEIDGIILPEVKIFFQNTVR